MLYYSIHSSLGWQPYCTIVYYSCLGWQPCCTIVYYSCLGWQPCCTIVLYYSSLGWQPCCTTVYYSSLGWQPCSIYYNILQHIEIDNLSRLRPSEIYKCSLNGVIDYSSILKFVFYKIFFTIRTTDTYQFLSNKFTLYALKARRRAR